MIQGHELPCYHYLATNSTLFYKHTIHGKLVGVVIFAWTTLDTVCHNVVATRELLYPHKMLLLQSGTCFLIFSTQYPTRINYNLNFDKLDPKTCFCSYLTFLFSDSRYGFLVRVKYYILVCRKSVWCLVLSWIVCLADYLVWWAGVWSLCLVV